MGSRAEVWIDPMSPPMAPCTSECGLLSMLKVNDLRKLTLPPGSIVSNFGSLVDSPAPVRSVLSRSCQSGFDAWVPVVKAAGIFGDV